MRGHVGPAVEVHDDEPAVDMFDEATDAAVRAGSQIIESQVSKDPQKYIGKPKFNL